MDYQTWSEEYRKEADKLQKHIQKLKQEAADCAPGGAKQRELNGRIYTLYSMYLECKHTADYLADYAKQDVQDLWEGSV